YQGSFQIAPDPAANAPVVTAFAPNFPATTTIGVPINAAIDILFSEPLDPASVNATNVVLTATGAPIAADVTLIQYGQVIRVRPQSPLAPSQQHFVTLQTGLKDVTGTPLAFTFTFSFATNAVAVPDTVGPRLLAISPPNGMSGLAI